MFYVCVSELSWKWSPLYGNQKVEAKMSGSIKRMKKIESSEQKSYTGEDTEFRSLVARFHSLSAPLVEWYRKTLGIGNGHVTHE